MASDLHPVFRGIIRQAESIDTRLGIHREEPQDERRKRNHKDKPDTDDDLWTDSAVVSVRALRTFLTGLLGTETAQAPTARVDEAPQPSPENRPAASPQAARAIHAYQNAPGGPKTEQAAAPQPASSTAQPPLTPEDQRTIRQLIADCDRLAAHQIDELRIEKSDSFLHSLAEAAQRKLTEIAG